MRIAAIDIGTNSIHMVIADAVGLGAFEVVERERDVVQIGRGSFSGGRLRRAAIERSVDALTRFAQLARRLQCDRILCTATAAVREAQNGGEFLQLARSLAGVTPRVIPAEEEGRLIYLAIKGALQIGPKPSLIVDIGGGSLQLVVGDEEKLRLATSAPVGALRLTELFLPSDPPTRGQVQKLRREIRRQTRGVLGRVAEFGPRVAYGSSGSIHALAQLAHHEESGEAIAQINGYFLATESVARIVRRLARMSIAQREKLPGIDARRAEIILPGAMVLEHVLQEAEIDGITISDFGVREGLVTDYIASHAAEVKELGPIEDLRLRSVVQLLRKFGPSGPHPEHVARLALALYDGLLDAHRLPPAMRELLQYAALLHDVGSVIGYDLHAEHSGYVIRNGHLRGLTAEEVAIVAVVARYHGKGRPRKRDAAIAAMAKPARRAVRWLSALLRIAEGLDRSHYQLIRQVRVARRGERWAILLTARRDAKLELWAARRRLDLLAELLGSRREPANVALRLDRASESTARVEEQRKLELERRRAKMAAAQGTKSGGGSAAGAAGSQSAARAPSGSGRLKVVARR
jgi:exopolyphosphatase/guanosine-5'-triphosphate,3'-diphosphate pyrophosphatase